MNGDNFLPLVRRWVLLLIAAAVASGAVGWFAASRISPTYESRARLLVGPLNTDIDTLRASGQLTRTYAELATGEQVLSKAAAALGPDVKVDALRRSVTANANDVTRLLTIRATSRDPVAAARTADAVAQEVMRLTSGTAPAAPATPAAPAAPAAPATPVPVAGTISSVETPEVPDHPIAPNVRVHVMLSMLAGVLMALTVAFVIESIGRGRQTKEPAPAPTPWPVATAAAPAGLAETHPAWGSATAGRFEG